MIFRFEDPFFLLLLGAIPLLAWWYVVRGRRNRGSLTHPDVAGLGRADRRQGRWLQHLPAGLRGLALVAFIVAFARPQTGVTGENVVTEGIDIVLALDISSSMLAEDLAPNRIEAAKAVAADFAGGRGNDRIGLVIFAGKAFTQAPLTLDHSVVVSLIGELEVGMIEDGTAVGMGLATAVKRLQASEAASKVVVLLTDGRNNRGEIDPVTAAQAAQALGVRVYTIGAGSRGTARVPITERHVAQEVFPDPFHRRRQGGAVEQIRFDQEAVLEKEVHFGGGHRTARFGEVRNVEHDACRRPCRFAGHVASGCCAEPF